MAVTNGGAAERAGIREQDLLVSLAGQPIPDAPTLHRALRRIAPGAQAQAILLRDGQRLEREITTQLGPAQAAIRPAPASRSERVTRHTAQSA
jgi:S1-C subfamily serine protease